MKKTIAFLECNTTGSGLAFLERALELGLQPHLFCNDPTLYTDIPSGTRVNRINTAGNPAELEGAIGLIHPAGVVTTSSHYLVLAARLAKGLGLPGPNPRAVINCVNKYRQRVTLAAADVRQPEFRFCASAKDAVDAAVELKYPIIVKPVEGSGKVGVSLVHDERDLLSWIEPLLRCQTNERGLPNTPGLLIEEFLPGREFSIECFHAIPLAVCEKQSRPPRFVEESHVTPPPRLSLQDSDSLRRLAVKALQALGLSWGPAHVEARLSELGEAVLIEVNPRLAGGNIPLLIAHASGVNLIEATILASLGAQVELAPSRHAAAAIAFVFAQQVGRLQAITGLDVAQRMPGIKLAKAYPQRSDLIRLWGDFRDRIAYIVATGEDPAQTLSKAATAASTIHLEILKCA